MSKIVFTLFDYSGEIRAETITHEYIYHLDGAHVSKLQRLAIFAPKRALNRLKALCPNPIRRTKHGGKQGKYQKN